MPYATIRALLANIVDYAGLFPPASLEMEAAVREFARQRASDEAWMLGRFVVPVARLGELEQASADIWGTQDGPFGLSVLVPGDLAAARQRIEAFQRSHAGAGHAAVEAVERQVSSPDEVAAATAAFADLEVYLEIPHREDPSPFMEALAHRGGRAKIRSGGVTADAFPTSAELARFITAAVRAGVPFKATAGLHHPLRGDYRLTYEPDSPSGTMHGFLNVFLASAWAKSGSMGREELAALLEERKPGAISWSDETVRWRGHEIDAASLAAARAGFATSYGSCSFEEPVSDLRELGLFRAPRRA